MAKFRQTKEDLEKRCYAQLAYIEALGRRALPIAIGMLEKRNVLLVKFNHKLIEELSDRKPPIPYVIKRKKEE